MDWTIFIVIVDRGKNVTYDCIIIDENDNIWIDNLQNTTKLLDIYMNLKLQIIIIHIP